MQDSDSVSSGSHLIPCYIRPLPCRKLVCAVATTVSLCNPTRLGWQVPCRMEHLSRNETLRSL